MYQSTTPTHTVKLPGRPAIPVIITGSQRNQRTTYLQVERMDGQLFGDGKPATWVAKSCVKPARPAEIIDCPRCGHEVSPTYAGEFGSEPTELVYRCRCGWDGGDDKPMDGDDELKKLGF